MKTTESTRDEVQNGTNGPRRAPLGDLAVLFLRLGATAFGGPAAHIAMMEDEIVEKRGWMTRERFLDLLGATNLIPGPNSTEMAIHIGYQRAGWPGLLVAGSCFILPAAAIVVAIAYAYVLYGSLPEAEGLLYGIKPVIIAVILQALWRLGRSAITSGVSAVVAAATLLLVFVGTDEVLVLVIAGLATVAVYRARRSAKDEEKESRDSDGTSAALVPLPFSSIAIPATAGTAAAAPFGLGTLFLFFLKTGSVLFGSGYVLLAFIRSDLVERLGWLTEAQLLDAVAIGQVTPGPVFTTATFIGYILGGFPGALVATVGIFLPAFVFVGISGPLVRRIRRSPSAGAFLDGVVAASLALMAAVTWQLGLAAVVDPLTIGLALVSAFLLFRYRLNSAWLVLGGAVAGLIATLVGT